MSNNIPESLKKAFANKTLIPLVGAGVSMSLRDKLDKKLFPSWSELLEHAGERLVKESKENHANIIKSSLAENDYQTAADWARKGLTGGLWNQFFKDVFDINRSDIDEASLALPKAIWNLSERVVTLNYDKTLSFACHQPDDVKELDNTRKDALLDFSRNSLGKPAVWHLHGNLDNLGKIILTSESYSKFYAESDSDYKAALSTLQSICSTANLIFIGCSLEDADLLQELGRQHNIFAGNIGPHYALVREVDRKLIQAKLNDFPFIEIVPFADFGQPLLDTIAAISTTTHETPVAPAAVTKMETPENAAVSTTKRIAILTANPIGENYDYRALTTEFEKLNCEINFYPLTIKALNDLEDFDYIFILSKLIKNNIVIEDEALQSARSNFKNIEDNIGNTNTKGVFIFLDHSTKTVFDTPDISTDIGALKLPTLIFPSLEKQHISSFHYQYFRKGNVTYVPEVIVFNLDLLQIEELKGTKKKIKNISRLSESIDKKNTLQYLGRKTEIQNLCREVVALQSVDEILTIKGSGGIGKTATVKKIAVAIAERNLFSEGIEFVDCEFISDYSSFEKKVAACFNLENALDIPQEIRSKLSKQEKLIILDNVETLLHLPDTQQIKDFIYFVCDYASFVVTTREILGLDCEKVIELNRYSTDDAYELFIKHLKRDAKDDIERRMIRQDIVEELLDNNPLAIKLVASNLPTGKKMKELKKELEEDVFRKASTDELSALDALSDVNIERKKSLYASINFSYKYLDEAEKKAFEILSLFPDGIHINVLKIIAGHRKTELRNSSNKLKVSDPVITDFIVKNLENKSIFQVDNQIIKLQSIMGKFAECQLYKRKENELTSYYKKASAYHIQFADFLFDVRQTEGPARAASRFNHQQANFFKSIDYIWAAGVSTGKLLDYLDNLQVFSSRISLSAKFATVLNRAVDLKLHFDDTNSQCCLKLIILSAEYFAGEFAEAFSALQKEMPLTKLKNYVPSSIVERIIGRNATNIYAMEGEALLNLKYDIQNKVNIFGYSSILFEIGEINSALISACKITFFTLDAKNALGTLDVNGIEKSIASTYEKEHLELMQLNYIKTKINLANKQHIESQLIQSLVIVNPYTRGLQQLMLAFASDTPAVAIELYEKALSNLTHIKYYYVEALLFYARYLQQQNMHSEFNRIYQEGYGLACTHYYRWLRYQFEDLIEKKTLPYNSADYPLPEDLDVEGYIQWLIKQNREN